MSAVTRRIREFGTLKALGWTSRRVVGQVLGESIVIGIVGGAVGVELGFLGAARSSTTSPGRSAPRCPRAPRRATPPRAARSGSAASAAQAAAGGGAGGGAGGAGGFPGGTGTRRHSTGSAAAGPTGSFRGGFARAADTASTVAVHLSAPVTITAIVLAVALAVLGGLIAGGFGGWRAARLRPAAALSKVA